MPLPPCCPQPCSVQSSPQAGIDPGACGCAVCLRPHWAHPQHRHPPKHPPNTTTHAALEPALLTPPPPPPPHPASSSACSANLFHVAVQRGSRPQRRLHLQHHASSHAIRHATPAATASGSRSQRASPTCMPPPATSHQAPCWMLARAAAVSPQQLPSCCLHRPWPIPGASVLPRCALRPHSPLCMRATHTHELCSHTLRVVLVLVQADDVRQRPGCDVQQICLGLHGRACDARDPQWRWQARMAWGTAQAKT